MDAVDPPMHCLGCGYDLVGLPPGACPECAREFDPVDPATWSPRPVVAWKSALRSRWTAYVLVSLGVVAGMWLTVLPRPFVSWDGKMDPLVWVWFDRPFGIERRTGSARLDLVWWDGRLRGVREYPVAGAPGGTTTGYSWEMRRSGDRWRLRVGADVPASSLLLAFNSMRDDSELFGISIADEAGEPVGFGGGTRLARSGAAPTQRRNEEAFEARGRQEDILASMLVAYDFTIRSSLISPEDEDLWVFDRERGRLERISVGEADERGVEYEVLDGMRVQRFGWP